MSSLDPDRERALLRQAQRGDVHAYCTVVAAQLPDLWRLCLAARLQRDDAERLLLEVARGGWVTLRPRGPADGMLAFLTRLVRVHAQAGGPPALARRPDGSPWTTATPAADDSGESQRVLAAFASLAVEDRLLLSLRLLARLAAPELGAAMGMPAEAVHPRLAWLRGALEACVRGLAPESESPPHLTLAHHAALLDGALTGAAQQERGSHLARCSACRDRQARLHRNDVVLRRVLDFDPGDGYRRGLAEHLERMLAAEAQGRPSGVRCAEAEVVDEAPPAAGPADSTAPLHASLDAVLAEFARGFEQPRTLREPVAPPRTAAELGRPPSRTLPRPAPPAPVAAAPATPSAPPPAPEPAAVAVPAPAPVMAAPPAAAPPPRRSRRWPLALVGAAALAMLVLYALPPVITVPAPRLPRIEVAARPAPAPAVTPAPLARTEPVPAPVVTPVPAPAAAAAPPMVAAVPRTPVPPAPAPRPAVTRAVPASPAPVPRPAPATPTAAAAEDDATDWPLLCGEVLDDAGAPVVGARVALADLDLSARTDRRGRFCLAAPAGERTWTITALGFTAARGVVAVRSGGEDLRVRLATTAP